MDGDSGSNKNDWSLATLLGGLHDDIEQRLARARQSFAHPVVKGDASEKVWLTLMQTYLPQRYQVTEAHVVDSNGRFSEQIDIVVFDRQYSPFIFQYEGQSIIPAESVYAVFEAKQTINAEMIAYAQKKVGSVRRLYRTSLPIPHAGGVYPPKPLPHIFGGFLSFGSDWKPALGEPLLKVLGNSEMESRLDIGCVASHGTFVLDGQGSHLVSSQGKAATRFLFELIALLQSSATAPMIDVRAYAKWIAS